MTLSANLYVPPEKQHRIVRLRSAHIKIGRRKAGGKVLRHTDTHAVYPGLRGRRLLGKYRAPLKGFGQIA